MSRLHRRRPREHFSPQGYLRGFVHPNRVGRPKPLWMLDIPSNQWVERSTSEVGYRRGLYAYSDPAGRVTAEDVFRTPERTFPQVRDAIRRSGFENWSRYRAGLVQFGAMLSARTPMFLRQVKTSSSDERTEGGQASVDAQDDAVINAMRQEVRARFPRWLGLHWVLRYTYDPDNAICTCDHAVGMEGEADDITHAAGQPATTIFFPVSWDMCLFGAAVPLMPPCDRLLPRDLERLRRLVHKQAREFVIATLPLFFGP